MKGTDFLRKKFPDLIGSEEVEKTAKRAKVRTGEGIQPQARIQNYLDRFNEIFQRKDEKARLRGIEALKKVLAKKFVIKEEDIPDGYFEKLIKISKSQGRGGEFEGQSIQEVRDEKAPAIIEDQILSLGKWIDYLSAPEANYPDWLKYWAMRSILQMGDAVKKTDDTGNTISIKYNKRTKNTVAPFPPVVPASLALTLGAIQEKLEKGGTKIKSNRLSEEEFSKLLTTENFSKIYSEFLAQQPEYRPEGLQETRGKWVTYEQGESAQRLVDSLEGYPLEWCLRNLSTAQEFLFLGNIHIYYSLNNNGEPVIPRLAIRMEGEKFGENPRGIAADQNLDPYIGPVLQEKLKELGEEGANYEKAVKDVERTTEIEQKLAEKKKLSIEDLRFIYEIDKRIEGFGYDDDPRINEIKAKRNLAKDLLTIYKGSNLASTIATLASEDRTELILDNLDNLAELTQKKIAEILLNSGHAGAIIRYRKQFDELTDADLLGLFAEAGEIRLLLRQYNVDVKNIDIDVITKLISAGQAALVAENIQAYENIDHNQVAQKLIDSGQTGELIRNLKNFRGLSRSLAEKFSRMGYSANVEKNQSSFHSK